MCSVSCETGIQNRQRTCTNPKPAFYGDHCFGPNVESKLCTEVPCADGGWSSWSSWSQCSTTCGTGIRSQSRSCDNPRPSTNGQYCIGDPMRVNTCFTKICRLPSDCSEAKLNNPEAQDGVHEVMLWKTHRKIQVYCDMTTDGGGWTVIINTNTTRLRHFADLEEEGPSYFPVDVNSRRFAYVFENIRVFADARIVAAYVNEVRINTKTGQGDISIVAGHHVFQNRYDGSVDFYRNYSQYVQGFGDLNTEFWLGLDYIQEMTSQHENNLRIDLMASNGTTAYETLSPFSLSLPNYVLHVGNTTSSKNIGSSDRFGPYHNGQAFSTYDHDVDHRGGSNCATSSHGAWWYDICYSANLNGQYLTPGTTDGTGMNYLSLNLPLYTTLKQSRMAFRRN